MQQHISLGHEDTEMAKIGLDAMMAAVNQLKI
jgi:hypothetical protein